MQGALRQVLLTHFADRENILNSSLRQLLAEKGVWGERPGAFPIESLHNWRPEHTETRPAIILKEGAWNWQRMGIGDSTGDDARSGRRTFLGFWQGTHTLFALGNTGVEAQILAVEIAKLMLWYASEISTQLALQRFVPVSVGEVAALKESKEHYVVPVTVAYVAPESWYIQQEAPRLKRIIFKTSEVLKNY